MPNAAQALLAAEHARRIAPLLARLQQGATLFYARKYDAAAATFRSVFQEAQDPSLADVAGRAWGDLGACQYLQYQYQAALQSFLKAQQLSEAGDPAKVVDWELNIASLYSQMGEFAAATKWLEDAMKRQAGLKRAEHWSELQMQMATLRAHQGRMAEATKLYEHALDRAYSQGNWELYALGWEHMGVSRLLRGELAQAERPLLEAYYARKLHHLPLQSSYRNLGRLRLEQGDITAASALLDLAVVLTAQPEGALPSWDIYHSRALVRLAQGRLPEALDDLRIAVRLGRAWRWATPADDASRVGTEGMLEKVHATLVEAGNRLYQENGDRDLVRETFTANEENRAASLRSLLRDPQQIEPDLPPAYWEAMQRLQRAEVAALRGGDSEGIEAARAAVVRLDAATGNAIRPLPTDLVDAIRNALDPNTTLFSFHEGDSISWVWAVNREGIEVYPLPPRQVIESQSRSVLAALRQGDGDRASLSATLFQTLFGPVAARFRQADRWLLALDETLFDLPVPALIETLSAQPTYVTENHTIEVVPSAAYWLEAEKRSEPRFAPVLVGVGDAIYNRADRRAAGVPDGGRDAVPLPRLVASGTEIDASARAWDGPAVLLRGADASREKLLEQLNRRPAVVHLATHYLQSAAQPAYALIALSLSRSGQTQLLTPFEISHWRIATGVVVLSGCHSAAGAELPGTGVMGLTRAWLAAGARSVVGTLWNTPDDDGTLFAALYRNLRGSSPMDPAGALRRAQIEMIHSGGPRARPEFWGAYFAVGDQGKAVLP